MADTSVINKVRYSGADFDTLNDDIRSRLQVQFAATYNDFAVSAQGIMLLDLVAFGLSTLSFYLDRRATDTYLETARTRKSVARIARQQGYKMGGAVSSGVDLSVSVTTAKTVDVTVIQGFKFQGPNNLVFEAAEQVVFTPAEQAAGTTKQIPCFEGETLTESFVSDGTANQVFELQRVPTGSFVVQGSVVVTVDSAAFVEEDLLTPGATDQFELGYNDEPATVRFGDGLAGNIPTASATIDVTYVASRGQEGQVANGTITEVVDDLVVAFETITLSINNPNPASGGDDPETLASAKAYAPLIRKARRAAVTSEDYQAIAGSFADPLFGRVAVAQSISTRSASADLTLQNLIADIDAAIASFHPEIDTQVTTATNSLDALDLNIVEVDAQNASIATALGNITTSTTTTQTNARTAQTGSNEIAVYASNIASASASGNVSTVSGNAEVDLYGPSGTGVLSAGEADGIKAFFNQASGFFDQIIAQASQTTTTSSAVTAATTAVLVEVDTVTTENTDATTASTAITVATGLATTNSATTRTAIVAIDAANTSVESDINVATAAIYAHVDSLLAADCQANLVTVPILTRDAGGFYTAPSSGLINALQTELDARKEVTQTISVTSGESFLVLATVAVRLGVSTGYALEVVRTAVEAAIDGLLRGRAFGASLYILDVQRVVDSVEGVRFSNATVGGSALDSDGNLVIDDSKVITKGTVTVTPELFVETT